MRVKIVNKRKDGVTLKVLDLPKRYSGISKQEATWDEFNESFELVEGEKFIYKLKKEEEDKLKKKTEFFSKMIPHVMSMRVKSGGASAFMQDTAMLSHLSDEYIKEFGGSIADFLTEYRESEKMFLESVMMMDGGAVGDIHTSKHDFHEKHWDKEDQDRIKKKQSEFNDSDGAMTLGDILKGKK